MITQPSVSITIDDRIRLIAAALAATDFPQTAQARNRHHAHAHARATMKYLKDGGHAQHPAIVGLQGLLDQNAPLEALFTLAMHFEWPGLRVKSLPRWAPADWNHHLWDFYETSRLQEHWDSARTAWDSARSQSENVFAGVKFRDFLEPFLGPIKEDFVFAPNISYPADQELGIRVFNQLIAITPPPQAWGDSPPWPYDDDAMVTHSYRAALTQYGRLLLVNYLRQNVEAVKDAAKRSLPVSEQMKSLYPTWEEQFTKLFITAAVAIYLEDYVSRAEAQAFTVMEKKVHGMTILPGTISVLRRYLQEHGNRYQTLADFLNLFPIQLRIAKKIVNM